MPKDLIAVGQGGAAIIDGSTPQNVAGFYTKGLETCVAIFLNGSKGGVKKYALIHVDISASIDSIESVVRKNFSEVEDYKLFAHPVVLEEGIQKRIFACNEAKISSLSFYQNNPKPYGYSGNGSLLVTIDRASGNAVCTVENNLTQLQERHIYDEHFRNYRENIHFLNEAFGTRKTPDNSLAIDVQYRGAGYTALPAFEQSSLSEDLKPLMGKDSAEIVSWLSSETTRKKYLPVALAIKANPGVEQIIANEIVEHFSNTEQCALTKYKIPLLPTLTNQRTAIENLAFSIGIDSNLTWHRETGEDSHCTVNLRSASLTTDVRNSVGLDRVKINKPTELQQKSLLDQIAGLVIENDKTNPSKVLITFSKNEENRGIIDGIMKPHSAVKTTGELPTKLTVEESLKLSSK